MTRAGRSSTSCGRSSISSPSANIRTYVQFYLFEAREAAKAPAAGAARSGRQGDHLRGEDQQGGRQLPGPGARQQEPSVAIQGGRRSFQVRQRRHSLGREGADRGRAEAPPGAAGICRARLSPAAVRRASATTCSAYYRSLREKDGLEPRRRDARFARERADVAGFLLPDRPGGTRSGRPAEPARQRARARPSTALPLSDYALASRLSYFLWSSMPDEELLAHAAAGDLHQPEVLAAQARRMLKDDARAALAVEFGGNWLDFRRFEEHNAVDRERFPEFHQRAARRRCSRSRSASSATCSSNNRSVLDFLYGKHTFVNPVLAKHYGMPDVDTAGAGRMGARRRCRPYGRGGLLPMAVFLTKNAPGLRTSPVKRGYWVVRRVLGEQIPPPPAGGARIAARRSQARAAAARNAGPASRRIRAAPPAIARFDSLRAGVRRLRPGRRDARQRIWPAGRSTRARRFPAAAKATVSRACASTFASSGRTISSTTCAANCWSTPWAAV